MRNRLGFVFLVSLTICGASPPPVILVDGWYPQCARAPVSSIATFGQLEAMLNDVGIATRYFRPCSVPRQSSYGRATIEELGQALGALIEQTLQETGSAQVDVIAFSVGSPTVRAYLSGKQNAPGVFKPPKNHKIRKVVFLGGMFFGVGNGHAPTPDPQDDAICTGTPFQWELNTWNQGGGDLREIDAIAVAGSGRPTQAGSAISDICDGDGVASLTTSSLSFAYLAERTRIITACHVSEVCLPTVSYVNSDSHPTWLIVRSFLAGTDEWRTVGSSPDRNPIQTANGGIFVGVKDAFDNLIPASRVSLGGRPLDQDSKSGPGLFYSDRVATGDYVLQATAAIPVPDVLFSPVPGTYSMITMKPGPLIASVMPSGAAIRQSLIDAGSAIEIRGTRLSAGQTAVATAPFPDTLGGAQVTVDNQPIPLRSVSDTQISAQLPSGLKGFVRLKVITSEGVHAFNMFVDDARPRIAQSGIVNAASFVSGAVAPGEFVTITGTNLGPLKSVTAAGSEKGLGGSKVMFGGIEAFLTYSSATQVNALVPYGAAGNADVTIQYNGGASDVFPLAVVDSAPGIFTQSYGPGQAWALNDDGMVNSQANRVARGGWVVFWATGQGLVSPDGQDGEILKTPKNVNLPVKVFIDGTEAPLIYAVLIYTGEIQVGVRVPAGSRTGDVPLLLNIGAASSRSDVTISVK